ncbi:MAG: type I restriction enzyme HsdR N-terminal domain-containing protein [Bacteroidales bacterium]|nr:type I restriction enzyme HsdR N-terminal domain-containing protein [Bacteroidales bacterium]
MINLNLPAFPLTLKEQRGKIYVFDCIRQKYVAFTPEEKVRQYIVHFLAEYRDYPLALMAIEMPFKVSRMRKRSDLVVYNSHTEPLMLVECKAPDVPLTDRVFDQAAVYNLQIKAPCILITNGVTHYCMELDPALNRYQFMIDIPYYSDLSTIAASLPAGESMY